MKKIVKQLSTIAITLFCFTSCSKEDLQPSAGNADKKSIVKENQPNLRSEGTLHTNMDFFQNSVAAVSYNTFPLLNVWTASSTTTESNSCASFQSGLKAKVISIVDNKITIQIQKANGASFGNTGTGYVKAISTCGNIAGNSTIQSNYTYVNIDFWATFTAGSVNFSPSITLSNGVRMYAPLITVSAKSDVAFEKYLVNGTNYNHFCQLNSTYLPSISCIPTSYMMLKKIVYPNAVFTGTELVRIAKGMGVSVNLGGTSLVSAGSFAKSDIGCGDNVVASSNIITSIEYIKSSLNSGKPLLAVTNLAGKHIVGIVGIKVMTNNNNSVIYYVDPLAKNAGVKEMNLINFLTSMRSASDYGLHNLLKIGC